MRVNKDRDLQLKILGHLGDLESIVHKDSSLLELRIHYEGHEVILIEHLFEDLLHLFLFWILVFQGHLHLELVTLFFLIFFIFFIFNNFIIASAFLHRINLMQFFINETFQCLEEAVVPVEDRKVGNGRPIIDKFQKVLVILNCLFGDLLVHGIARKFINLLDDGVLVLGVLVARFLSFLRRNMLVEVLLLLLVVL